MIRYLVAAMAVLGAAETAIAQSLEDFAALPGVFDPRLSRDGRYLAIGCRAEQRTRVCLYDLDEGGSTKLFGVPEPLFQGGHYFAGPEHLIVHGWFSEVPPGATSDVVFRLRRAMSFNIETGQAAEFMENRPGVFDNRRVVSLDTSDPGSVIVEMPGPELYRVDLETGRGRLMERNSIAGHVVRPDGTVSAHILFRSSNSTYTFRRIEGGREELYEGVHPIYFPRFRGFDESGGYIFTFLGGEQRGVWRLDAETGEFTPLAPETDGRVFTPIFNPTSRVVVGYSRYSGDLTAQTFLDERLARDAAALAEALDVERVLLRTWSEDRNRLVFSINDAGRPSTYYLYERSAGRVSPIGASHPQFEGVELGSVTPYTFNASDGLEIPGFLTLPPGRTAEDGPFPLVVMPHGGPYSRDDLHYDWWRQAYASRGYAVLQPNFRGSFGYGPEFQRAGFGEFGDLMIQDLLDGAQSLREAGVAEAGPACFAGASYGGYAALMAAIRAPDEVACVVAVAPVTDPIAILGDASRYGSESSLEFWQQYIGDRFMGSEAGDRLAPMRRADEIGAPTLVMHGDQDLVVRIEESEILARNSSDREDFTFIPMEGVDHGLSSADARLRVLEESLALIGDTLR